MFSPVCFHPCCVFPPFIWNLFFWDAGQAVICNKVESFLKIWGWSFQIFQVCIFFPRLTYLWLHWNYLCGLWLRCASLGRKGPCLFFSNSVLGFSSSCQETSVILWRPLKMWGRITSVMFSTHGFACCASASDQFSHQAEIPSISHRTEISGKLPLFPEQKNKNKCKLRNISVWDFLFPLPVTGTSLNNLPLCIQVLLVCSSQEGETGQSLCQSRGN